MWRRCASCAAGIPTPSEACGASCESLNLKNLFTKDGYEYAGYQVLNEEDEYVTYEGDEYIVEAPNALQLLCRKESGEAAG